MKTKLLELISENYKVEYAINEFKKKPALYEKIVLTLMTLGDFPKKVECALFSESYEDGEVIKIWLEDNSGNAFLICPVSNNVNDLKIITMLNDGKEQNYDVSLSKKSTINNDNVSLLRTDNVYSFKYGRLITNKFDYYNIFFGDGICYQIHLFDNDLSIDYSTLINMLNSFDKIPNFKEFADALNAGLSQQKYSSLTMSISFFKDHNLMGSIRLDKNQILSLKRNKD